MLKRIIKRNGSIENYSESKIMKWAKWSAGELNIDYESIVSKVVSKFHTQAKSTELQQGLISEFLQLGTSSGNKMAGRLYMADVAVDVHDRVYPPLKYQLKKTKKLGLMRHLDYTDDELDEIDKYIDHDRNMEMSYDQIKQIYKKYSLNNRVKNKIYETPQYVYMRIALHVCEDEDKASRITSVIEVYEYLSKNKVNSPSPNYINIGTNHLGLASCCLYTTGDSLDSIEAGNHVAYKMTAMSAGIGGYMALRSIGDPIRSGTIVHQGKMPYLNDIGGRVIANIQAGRGGACNQFYSIYDPEALLMAQAQNPRTPESRKNRNIHFTAMFNDFFFWKANFKKKIFTFTAFSAPDLHAALFCGDNKKFAEIYKVYEEDDNFVKNYVDAAKLLADVAQQAPEVATHYEINIGEINRHTPFKEPIHCSNLCVEITQVTYSYKHVLELYEENDDVTGEVSLCSLGAIVEPNIVDDDDYLRAAYVSLKIIDFCIDKSTYVLPHIGYTAKRRRNAGVGIIGIAHTLARKGIRYSSPEGLLEHHRMAERHAYFCIKASLQLGKERGNAEWIHKTKWPEGWVPTKTYKRTVDQLIDPSNERYDWEDLSQQIIANKGIRNSSVIAHMPTESSSKATGFPNSIYPVRALVLTKSDLNNTIEWVAKDNDKFGEHYELAYTIDPKRMIDTYAVWQKFTDQSISADEYIDRSVNPWLSQVEMVDRKLYANHFGIKSKYYTNSLTSNQDYDKADDGSAACGSGGCTV